MQQKEDELNDRRVKNQALLDKLQDEAREAKDKLKETKDKEDAMSDVLVGILTTLTLWICVMVCWSHYNCKQHDAVGALGDDNEKLVK